MMLRSRYLNFEAGLSLVEPIAGPVFDSEDFKEGKLAFFEKRKPKWQVK
jgi:hypothetical protein